MNLKKTIILVSIWIFLFSPMIAHPYTSVLDEIDFIQIQKMKLRKEKKEYFMDVVCVVRNSSKGTLKLKDGQFRLAFAPEDSNEIRLGKSILKDDFILEKKEDASYTDTPVQFTINLGEDIRQLHLNIISSDEMSGLLTNPKPKVHLHIQGEFQLSMHAGQAWLHQKGIRIDWVLRIDVVRDVLVKAYKTIELTADKGKIPSEAEVEERFEAEANKAFEEENDELFQ